MPTLIVLRPAGLVQRSIIMISRSQGHQYP